MEEMIRKISDDKIKPTLLLHSCCAPCSSYVLKKLNVYFDITVFYYNPNIEPLDEYLKREQEQITFINQFNLENKIAFAHAPYEPEAFHDAIKGFESEKEGGMRCFKCYELRLRKTAEFAKQNGFDYFTTTLSISPYKNANKLNEIGERISKELKLKYLYADFKKKEGYKQSIILSDEYGLYRQDYCGCLYSKAESEKRRLKHL